jgi:D-threo-aldose 1-dehydrogenase
MDSDADRVLPSGLQLPRLGLGTAPIGGLYAPVTEAAAQATITAAFDLGLRFFDTAPLYGSGLAEERLGRALRHREPSYVLSTKVGRILEPHSGSVAASHDSMFKSSSTSTPVFDFSADGIRKSVEASRSRLGIDRFDILFLHDPDEHMTEALGEAFPTLTAMRQAGEIEAVGVGTNRVGPAMRFVSACDPDCILVAGRYTLLDTSAADELLPLCAKRGIGVVLGGVFNSGILARPEPGGTFDYLPTPAATFTRVKALGAVCSRYDIPLMAVALQFAAAHPAVTSVLVGARTPAEITQNIEMSELAIPSALWAELHRRDLLPRELPTPTTGR